MLELLVVLEELEVLTQVARRTYPGGYVYLSRLLGVLTQVTRCTYPGSYGDENDPKNGKFVQ